MSRPETERGGDGEGSFLAFKLHRFISGAGHAYATLRPEGQRRVSLDGQRFDPEDPEARLYPTYFCRACGQEYHSVTLTAADGATRSCLGQSTTRRCRTPTATSIAGYLMPEPRRTMQNSRFQGPRPTFPRSGKKQGPNGLRLKADKRKNVPRRVEVAADGVVAAGGRPCWFIPGKFGFCLSCGEMPAGQAREFNKLASLSAEGRSSATTLLVSSALRWMNQTRVSHSQRQAEASWLYGQPPRRRAASGTLQRLYFRLASARCDTGGAAQGRSDGAWRRRDRRADPRGSRLQSQQPAAPGRMDARPGCQGRRPAQRRQGDRQSALVSRVV